MKLARVRSDQIVVVKLSTRHHIVAEARELKGAGFGQRNVVLIMPGEWRLRAESYEDFQLLAAAVPRGYVITTWSGEERMGGRVESAGDGDPRRIDSPDIQS